MYERFDFWPYNMCSDEMFKQYSNDRKYHLDQKKMFDSYVSEYRRPTPKRIWQEYIIE